MSEQMAGAVSVRPSRGRWYVLLIISAMYLITYLDRVNISTAAPLISKEFGFDKVTMGVHLYRLRLGLCGFPGSRRLARPTDLARAASWPASSPIGRS